MVSYTCLMDMPSGFCFSALNRRTAALCASDFDAPLLDGGRSWPNLLPLWLWVRRSCCLCCRRCSWGITITTSQRRYDRIIRCHHPDLDGWGMTSLIHPESLETTTYHPVDDFVGDVALRKSSQNHGLWNLETSSASQDHLIDL